jgi:predicted RNA binding protein YcfA (HicA-like mRNA interferase family)
MKLKELERHMREHGCVLGREGGKHTIWVNPAKHKYTSVLRHREIKEYTARAICKQLEIPIP